MHPATRTVAVALLTGLVSIAPARAQGTPPAGDLNSERPTAELIAEIDSPDAARARAAFDTLVRRGAEILPELERRLAATGAKAIAELYLAVRSPSEIVPTGVDLPQDTLRSDDELAALTPTISTRDMSVWEKALYSKYLDAVRMVKVGRYDQAIRLCEAILVVDPQVRFRNQVKQLKVWSDERLLLRTIVRVTVGTDRNLYEIGEVVDVTFTLENLTADLLELDFTPSEEVKDAAMHKYFETYKPAAIFRVTYAQYDPIGTVVSHQNMQLIEIDRQIRLAPGQKWVRSFSIDTMRDDPTNQLFRTYKIEGELRPIQIRHGGQHIFRRIAIEPTTVRVFPPDVDPALQDPLGFLRRALAGGFPNDIFLCALLVPEKDRDAELELLLTALVGGKPAVQQALMAALRQITREPIPFDVDAWVRWYADWGHDKLEKAGPPDEDE